MEDDLYRDEHFDKSSFNKGHYFEAMDRCHILQCQLESALHNHPGLNDDEARKIQQVSNLLMEVYQAVGRREYDEYGE